MSLSSSDLDPRAQTWFASRTSSWPDWPVADVVAAKGEHRVAVVIPARDEEQTIADVVTLIRRDLVGEAPLVDELVVHGWVDEDWVAAHTAAPFGEEEA